MIFRLEGEGPPLEEKQPRWGICDQRGGIRRPARLEAVAQRGAVDETSIELLHASLCLSLLDMAAASSVEPPSVGSNGEWRRARGRRFQPVK
uniref:Uncharacterized protein n=1 Tax=Oryza glumipatula TaxID=40148 RepID=A0A0D9ZSX6_9ORYZ